MSIEIPIPQHVLDKAIVDACETVRQQYLQELYGQLAKL